MPAEDGRRRVNRTLGPQTHTVSCELGKPSHKSIGQAVSCSGRDSKGTRVVSQISSSSLWGVETLARTEWNSTSPPAPELYGSSEGPEQRPRDIEARGGWERERKRKGCLSGRRRPGHHPHPAGAGHHAMLPARAARTRCAAHTPARVPRRPHPPAPRARTGRPRQPAPVHAARAPRQPAPARPHQRARRKAR